MVSSAHHRAPIRVDRVAGVEDEEIELRLIRFPTCLTSTGSITLFRTRIRGVGARHGCGAGTTGTELELRPRRSAAVDEQCLQQSLKVTENPTVSSLSTAQVVSCR